MGENCGRKLWEESLKKESETENKPLEETREGDYGGEWKETVGDDYGRKFWRR